MEDHEAKIGCFIICLVALFACLFAAAEGVKASGGLNIEYSEGSRSGVIQKFSKRGVIWSTREGELNLGYNTASGSGRNVTIAPEIFYFSCSSPEIADAITEAQEGGHRVTLLYKQYLLRGYRYGGTSYDIVGVKTAKEGHAELQ